VLLPSSDVVFRRLGATGVLVHLGTNEIFELNDTGARIWELIVAGQDEPSIAVALAAEFHVDEPTASREVARLAGELRSRQLITSP
jgi:hypothetical protein